MVSVVEELIKSFYIITFTISVKKKFPLHADVYESVPSPLNRAYYMAVYCHLAVDTGQTRSVDKLLLTCDNVILFA